MKRFAVRHREILKMSFEEAVNYATQKLSDLNNSNLFLHADRVEKTIEFQVIGNDDFNWAEMIQTSKTSYNDFVKLKMYCSRCLRENRVLERQLSEWLCNYLDGVLESPTRSRGAPQALRAREWFIALLIQEVARTVKLYISRNDASDAKSACDVLCQAVIAINRDNPSQKPLKLTSYDEMRKLYTRAKKRGFSVGD